MASKAKQEVDPVAVAPERIVQVAVRMHEMVALTSEGRLFIFDGEAWRELVLPDFSAGEITKSGI